MELKQYLRILYRRWWIIVALVVVVFAGSLALAKPAPPTYSASLRFTIGLAAEQTESNPYYDPAYYKWLVSEYITDDFSEIVKSQVFAQDVSQCTGGTVPAGAIQGAANTQKLHRILTLTISGSNPQQVGDIATCAAKMLQENNAKYFAQLNTFKASIQVIDEPTLVSSTPGLRERLDLPIRVFLGLLAGLALAFLIDYLDDAVREASDLQALGIAVLGEIPNPSRWGRRRP